ncbi:MAG: cold shock domain-containing protein [Candidatus Promineifilaceae bacterium]|jgi:CspA family cold shock protein
MPNFRDRRETDKDGNELIFTVEVQRRLSQAGLPVEVAYIDQLGPLPEAAPQQSKPKQERGSKPSAPPKDEIEEPESIQIDPMSGKYVGRVKWYNVRKGYGFLLRGAGEEIFFHRSSAVGDAEDLKDGQWILYDVEETDKGPEATDIEPYDNPEA